MPIAYGRCMEIIDFKWFSSPHPFNHRAVAPPLFEVDTYLATCRYPWHSALSVCKDLCILVPSCITTSRIQHPANHRTPASAALQRCRCRRQAASSASSIVDASRSRYRCQCVRADDAGRRATLCVTQW